MELTWKLGEPYPVAAVSGLLTLRDALTICILTCDGAHERGFSNFLLDVSAVTGQLSTFEQYELGKTVADYCSAHGWHYKVAVVGSPTTVTGFGLLVASNRGLVVEHFSTGKRP
jgi:hypothetical protein